MSIGARGQGGHGNCRLCGTAAYASDDAGPVHRCCTAWQAVIAAGDPCPSCQAARWLATPKPRGAQMAPLPALLPDGRPYVPESEGLRPHLARREQGRYPHLEEEMQENEAGTWLAREEDGRVLEVNAAGYPGAEASPDDGRAVAEAETRTNLARQLERKAVEHLLNRPGAESIAPAAGGRDAAWMESYQAKVAELQQQNREYLADRAQDLAGELEAEAG